MAGVFLPMVSDLGVSLDHLERATPIVTGFLFGYVVAIPLLGPLSDARGRTALYLGALTVFAGGSVITARAEDLNTLVVGRTVQGLAGGALVPVSLGLVADAFPGPSRLLALGIAAGAQEAGSLIGPVYGAYVAQWAGGWRTVFWINLPLAALCTIAFLLLARPTSPEPAPNGLKGTVYQSGAGSVGRGAVLAVAMGLLVLALSPDDPARSAVSSHFAPLITGAAVAFGAFLLLRGRSAIPAAVIVNVLVGAGLVAALAEVPVLATSLFGLDQLGAALLLARFLAGVPVGAVAGGLLPNRRWTATAGMALSAACFGRMAGWTALDASVPWILFACGLGFGLVIAPVTAAILDAARSEEHGAASASAVLARSAGMLAGLGLLAAYGFHRFYSELARCPRGGGFLGLPGSQFIACATAAGRDQYHDVFVLAAGLCVIAAAAASLRLR